MKKYLYALVVLLLIFLLWFAYNYPDWIVAGPPDQHNSQQPVDSCPPGSYPIGSADDPACKLEPTGCPYGDSIPLDSPKCTAPDPSAWEPWTPGPELKEMEGK